MTDPRNPPETSLGDPGDQNKWHTLFGGSNLNPPEQVDTVQGSNLNPPGKLDYLGYRPEKLFETLETEPLYVVTLFNCICLIVFLKKKELWWAGLGKMCNRSRNQAENYLSIRATNQSLSN